MQNFWFGLGKVGLNFLNIIPQLGKVVYNFFGDLFTNIFNSIYNQQIDQKSARNVIIGFFAVVGVTTAIVAGINTYKNFDKIKNKFETKKPEVKVQKEVKKPEIK